MRNSLRRDMTKLAPNRADADAEPASPPPHTIKSRASWGGRPLRVNGTWQLFVTEIAAGCPLILFMNNSMVVRAESTTGSATGPYARAADDAGGLVVSAALALGSLARLRRA